MHNCGKHFPGHGFVKADSHVEIPVDDRPLATILADDARPYEWLAGTLASVMPAHVIYPQVDAHPAGFSARWLREILRLELGFDGAIFSDDLSMAGARRVGGVEVSYAEAAALALDAGCDMVLLCNQSLDGGAAVDAPARRAARGPRRPAIGKPIPTAKRVASICCRRRRRSSGTISCTRRPTSARSSACPKRKRKQGAGGRTRAPFGASAPSLEALAVSRGVVSNGSLTCARSFFVSTSTSGPSSTTATARDVARRADRRRRCRHRRLRGLDLAGVRVHPLQAGRFGDRDQRVQRQRVRRRRRRARRLGPARRAPARSAAGADRSAASGERHASGAASRAGSTSRRGAGARPPSSARAAAAAGRFAARRPGERRLPNGVDMGSVASLRSLASASLPIASPSRGPAFAVPPAAAAPRRRLPRRAGSAAAPSPVGAPVAIVARARRSCRST